MVHVCRNFQVTHKNHRNFIFHTNLRLHPSVNLQFVILLFFLLKNELNSAQRASLTSRFIISESQHPNLNQQYATSESASQMRLYLTSFRKSRLAFRFGCFAIRALASSAPNTNQKKATTNELFQNVRFLSFSLHGTTCNTRIPYITVCLFRLFKIPKRRLLPMTVLDGLPINSLLPVVLSKYNFHLANVFSLIWPRYTFGSLR